MARGTSLMEPELMTQGRTKAREAELRGWVKLHPSERLRQRNELTALPTAMLCHVMPCHAMHDRKSSRRPGFRERASERLLVGWLTDRLAGWLV
jgi:hypothetical protein